MIFFLGVNIPLDDAGRASLAKQEKLIGGVTICFILFLSSISSDATIEKDWKFADSYEITL